jgi:hypothetical protein
LFALFSCGNPNPQEPLISKEYKLIHSFNYEQCGTVYEDLEVSSQYKLETNMQTLTLIPNQEVEKELVEMNLPKQMCFYSNSDTQVGIEGNIFHTEFMNFHNESI